MKNKLITIILVLILITGVGILLYPFVSNLLHEKKQDIIITDYEENIEQMEDPQKEAMLALAREYNENLINTVTLTDPFDPEAVKLATEGYEEILHFNESGIMGYVEIPRIGIYEAIYHGVSDVVLAKGIGHLANTSFPIGGKGTHAVISGHTGLPDAELFTNLPQLQEGDIFYIHMLDDILAYQVDQIKVVEPYDISDLRVNLEEDYVTMVTCTPYGINSHRLLVRGTRTEYTPELAAVAENQKEEGMEKEEWKLVYVRALIAGGLISLAVMVLVTNIRRAGKRRHQQMKKRDRRRRR